MFDGLMSILGVVFGGAIGTILKIVLVVLIGSLAIWYAIVNRKQGRATAAKATQVGKAKEVVALPDENRLISEASKSAEDDVEKMLKEAENGAKS